MAAAIEQYEELAYLIGMTPAQFWGSTLKEFEKQANAFSKLEKKRDSRAALICSVLAEVNRDRKKRKKPYKVEDFMPKERKQQTWEQQLKFVEILNKALGGEDKRGD